MQAESKITRELEDGERLLWSGMPLRGFRLRPSDIFVIPFTMMWCGFAFFWEGSVMTQHAPFFFKLWGVPFVLIGLYITVGRFYADKIWRSRTYYGLTDKRILIVNGDKMRSVTSMALKTLSQISLKEQADKSGTILLGNPPYFGNRHYIAGLNNFNGRTIMPSFDMIPRARQVYDMIKNAQFKSE